MLFDIINPSDPYTMKSDDRLTAAVACILLGRGKYGLSDEDGEEACPLMLSEHAAAEWAQKHLGTADVSAGLDSYIDAHKEAVAATLDSVLIGKTDERQAFEKAMEQVQDSKDCERAWAAYHDERRSSMNDIGTRAKRLAANLRGKDVDVPEDGCMILRG